MKAEDAVNILSALASEARLAIFRLLVKRGPAGYTPSDLIDRLHVAAPTLSFHLRELLHAELIVCRRDGRKLYYSPNFGHMKQLMGFLTDHCCSLADEACDSNCEPLTATLQRRRA